MNPATQNGTLRGRIGTILIFFFGIVLVGSAAAKFAQIPKVTSQMATFGFAGNSLLFIGVLEAASATLFMIPRSRAFGLLLVSAYLGGAIATHIGHNQLQQSASPAILLGLLWTAAWLRNPEMLWSLSR